MRKLSVFAAAALTALAACCVWGEWVYEGKWGREGRGDGEFISPSGIAVAPSGRVYVADRDNQRIQYFLAEGSFLGKWGASGSGNGEFDSPGGVEIAPGGRVYVGDTGNHRVQYFTRNGPFAVP